MMSRKRRGVEHRVENLRANPCGSSVQCELELSEKYRENGSPILRNRTAAAALTRSAGSKLVIAFLQVHLLPGMRKWGIGLI